MNGGYAYRERIRDRSAGVTVLDHLAARYPHTTREGWTSHLVAGHVELDGRTARADDRLVAGASLVWHRPPWREPDAPLTFDVLYEDDRLLAVHKPAGLPTLPGGGFLEHTLVHQARRRGPAWSPAHRLGRHTSGIVLLTHDRATAAALHQQFAARQVHKRYRAAIDGRPAVAHFDVEAPIGPVPYPPLGFLHAATPDGRPSRSTFTVAEHRQHTTLVDVVIHTGRPHQIRVHAAAAGHPLTGDPLYAAGGRPRPGCTAVPGDPGYLLHAAEVVLQHPDGGPLRVTCEPPPPLTVGGRSRSSAG